MVWIFLPFIVQALVIMIDEIYFHLKRGLPRWERIGHPLDTLSLLICLLFILFVPFSQMSLKIYSALALLSCVLVTKDEFVHKHHCPAAENWVHAFLFLLHPLILIASALFWPAIHNETSFSWIAPYLPANSLLTLLFTFYTISISFFFIYQVIFWNFVWKEKT